MLKKLIAIATAITIMMVGFTGCGEPADTTTGTSVYKMTDDIRTNEYVEKVFVDEYKGMCSSDEDAIKFGESILWLDCQKIVPSKIIYNWDDDTININGKEYKPTSIADGAYRSELELSNSQLLTFYKNNMEYTILTDDYGRITFYYDIEN